MPPPQTHKFHEILRIGQGQASGIDWLSDGRLLVTSNLGAWVYADTPNNGHSGILQSATALDNFPLQMRHTRLSRDGRYIASPRSGYQEIVVWDAKHQSTTATLTGHEAVIELAWSPDASKLAVADQNMIKVWDIATSQQELLLEGHNRSIKSISWNPDGSQLVSVDLDGIIKTWDLLNSGQELLSVSTSHTADTVAWHPDGSSIAYSGPAIIGLLDPNTGDTLHTLADSSLEPDLVRTIVWNPDGTQLAEGTEGGSIHLWDMQTLEPVLSIHNAHLTPIIRLAWSPDGGQIASQPEAAGFSSFPQDATVNIWSTITGENQRVIATFFTPAEEIQWQPGSGIFSSFNIGMGVNTWDESTITLLNTYQADATLTTASWSPEWTYLAVATADRDIHLINPVTGQVEQTMTSKFNVSFLTWRPDETQLASADRSLEVWNAASGSLALEIDLTALGRAHIGSWSPDGASIALGHDDKVTIVNAFNGQVAKTLQAPNMESVGGLSWKPDSTQLAATSANGQVLVWNIQTEQVVYELTGHTANVPAVAWSPDGTRLVSGSVDTTIKIWDMQDGSLIDTLTGHASSVTSLAWNSDGTRFASGSYDGTVRVWAQTP
jgi:WD40 repeat protein